MRIPDYKTWSELIRTQSISGRHDEVLSIFLSKLRHPFGFKPDHLVLQTALKSCAILPALNVGRVLHSFVVKLGHLSCLSVSKGLLNVYAKNKAYNDCKKLFNQMPKHDPVVWNIMLAGLAGPQIHDVEVMRLVYNMHACQETELSPVSIAIVLPVCARLGCLNAGKSIHSYAVKSGWASETLVGNSLVSMYAKCGMVHDGAYASFCEIYDKDVISWNALIAGFAENGFYNDAYVFFRRMLLGCVAPNYATLASILPICAALDRDIAYGLGRELHAYALRHNELQKDVFVINALMSFYFRMGQMLEPDSVTLVSVLPACAHLQNLWAFITMSQRDLISWNSMLDAFAESGYELKLVNILYQLFEEGLRPDSITLLTLIRFYGSISQLSKVKEAHGYLLRACICQNNTQPTLGYMTCNLQAEACKVLEGMSQNDLATRNLMIRAYAENNCLEQAVALLFKLQVQGMKPDATTIMSILPMCAKMASTHMLRQCHGYMVRAGIEDVQLKGSMIDVYSKCGNLSLANKLFWSSSYKDLVMFTALIGGYAMHGTGKEALVLFKQMLVLGMRPDHVVLTAILSACSHAGLVDEGLKIFHSIEKFYGVKPTMEQYGCVVDLLARQGKIKDAYNFVIEMPMKANANIWSILLGACRTYHEVELNKKWDGVFEIRKMMRSKDLKKPAGCSWIEVDRRRRIFVSGDYSHPETNAIYFTLMALDKKDRHSCLLDKCNRTAVKIEKRVAEAKSPVKLFHGALIKVVSFITSDGLQQSVR
ncbi:hypothetical protein RDABS01_029647 [Bienertia sinuspersici]